MTVPFLRPRRLRDNALLRDAVAEFDVSLNNLMLPMFVADVDGDQEIKGMPGVSQRNVEGVATTIESLVEKGLRAFILFGVPDHKDGEASAATDDDGIIPTTIRAIRARVGDNALITTDVSVCSYTDHGHCGHLATTGDTFRVDNDKSIELIAQMALTHARAGADMVAPSDMMDGRVRRIREVLDADGLSHLPIMSYAVKYASSLYGPFRHAADSAPKSGDRRGYQMDFRNRKDAVREALLDVDEGADILMVKPAIAYLDILRDLSERCELPLAAYQVSGEYAMIRYAAEADAIDEARVVLESWIAMRRAGAQIILSYHAEHAVNHGWLTP